MKRNNVIVIAGGAWQLFLVKYLKAKGHTVYVVNPVRSETVQAADHHIPLDIRCTDAIATYIRKRRVDPLFITSDQSDIATLSVAVLSQEFELPGNPPVVVARFTDKALMYGFAEEIGLPVPVFAKATSLQHVHQFVSTNGLPIIMKPSHSTASRGFSKIDKQEQIAPAFQRARAYSDVIVQRYIGGKDILELTVEGICSRGSHRTLTVARRHMCCPGINYALRYPSGLAVHALCQANDRFVNRSGLKFGLTHAEYFFQPHTGRFWLTEIAARGGGVGIASHVVPWVTGMDTYGFLYQNLRYGACDLQAPLVSPRCALVHFFHRQEMEHLTAKEIRRIDKIGGLFFYNYRRHDFIRSDDNDLNTRHSLAIFLRSTNEEIDRDLARVRQVIGERNIVTTRQAC